MLVCGVKTPLVGPVLVALRREQDLPVLDSVACKDQDRGNFYPLSSPQ